MRWEALADGLVERLRPTLPEGMVIQAELGGVTIAQPGVPHAVCHIEVEGIVEQSGDRDEHIEVAAYSLLLVVQDFVAEFTGSPWPGVHELPPPAARREAGMLHLWYGKRRSPVLSLKPLPID